MYRDVIEGPHIVLYMEIIKSPTAELYREVIEGPPTRLSRKVIALASCFYLMGQHKPYCSVGRCSSLQYSVVFFMDRGMELLGGRKSATVFKY